MSENWSASSVDEAVGLHVPQEDPGATLAGMGADWVHSSPESGSTTSDGRTRDLDELSPLVDDHFTRRVEGTEVSKLTVSSVTDGVHSDPSSHALLCSGNVVDASKSQISEDIRDLEMATDRVQNATGEDAAGCSNRLLIGKVSSCLVHKSSKVSCIEICEEYAFLGWSDGRITKASLCSFSNMFVATDCTVQRCWVMESEEAMSLLSASATLKFTTDECGKWFKPREPVIQILCVQELSFLVANIKGVVIAVKLDKNFNLGNWIEITRGVKSMRICEGCGSPGRAQLLLACGRLVHTVDLRDIHSNLARETPARPTVKLRFCLRDNVSSAIWSNDLLWCICDTGQFPVFVTAMVEPDVYCEAMPICNDIVNFFGKMPVELIGQPYILTALKDENVAIVHRNSALISNGRTILRTISLLRSAICCVEAYPYFIVVASSTFTDQDVSSLTFSLFGVGEVESRYGALDIYDMRSDELVVKVSVDDTSRVCSVFKRTIMFVSETCVLGLRVPSFQLQLEKTLSHEAALPRGARFIHSEPVLDDSMRFCLVKYNEENIDVSTHPSDEHLLLNRMVNRVDLEDKSPYWLVHETAGALERRYTCCVFDVDRYKIAKCCEQICESIIDRSFELIEEASIRSQRQILGGVDPRVFNLLTGSALATPPTSSQESLVMTLLGVSRTNQSMDGAKIMPPFIPIDDDSVASAYLCCASPDVASLGAGGPTIDNVGKKLLLERGEVHLPSHEHWLEEPLFCDICLYDVATEKRASESFYLNVNTSERVVQMIEDIVSEPVDLNQSRGLLGPLYPRPSLWIFVRFSAFYHGDVASTSGKFLAPGQKVSSKTLAAALERRKGMRDLSSYKQPMFYGCVPVFNDDGTIRGSNGLVKVPLVAAKQSSMDDDDILDLCRTLKDDARFMGEQPAKIKDLIPGSFSLKLSLFDETAMGCVSGTGHPAQVKAGAVQSWGVQQESGSNAIRLYKSLSAGSISNCKDVITYSDFASISPMEPSNLLYIYPESVDCTGFPRAMNGRAIHNIAVCASLRGDDTQPLCPAEVCAVSPTCSFFLREELVSGLTYRNRDPSFSNEMKFLLPGKLTDKHHILFKFVAVGGFNTDKKRKQPLSENVFAFAVLPILRSHGNIIPNGGYSTFLTKTLSSNYLRQFDRESSQSHEDVFEVSVRSISCLYPRDPVVARTLRVAACLRMTGRPLTELTSCFINLPLALAQQLYAFFPCICHSLLEVLTSSDLSDRMIAFNTLVKVLTRIKKKMFYAAFQQFVNNFVVFNGSIDSPITLSCNLLGCFCEIIEKASRPYDAEWGELFEYLPIILALCCKSIASGTAVAETVNVQEFVEAACKLALALSGVVSYSLWSNYGFAARVVKVTATFVFDLMHLNMVHCVRLFSHRFLTGFRGPVGTDKVLVLKAIYLTRLVQHPQYLDFCGCSSGASLSFLVVDSSIMSVKASSPAGVRPLHAVLNLFSSDPSSREKAANLHFEFVKMFLSAFSDDISKSEHVDKLMYPLLHILREASTMYVERICMDCLSATKDREYGNQLFSLLHALLDLDSEHFLRVRTKSCLLIVDLMRCFLSVASRGDTDNVSPSLLFLVQRLLMRVLFVDTTHHLFLRVCQVVDTMIYLFPHSYFSSKFQLSFDLLTSLYGIFSLDRIPKSPRMVACSLFFSVMERSCAFHSSLGKLLSESAMALSTFIQSKTLAISGELWDQQCIGSVFANLIIYANDPAFSERVVPSAQHSDALDLLTRLLKLLQDSVEYSEEVQNRPVVVNDERARMEVMVELQFCLAEVSAHSMELRLQWLSSVKQTHMQTQNWLQAAHAGLEAVMQVHTLLDQAGLVPGHLLLLTREALPTQSLESAPYGLRWLNPANVQLTIESVAAWIVTGHHGLGDGSASQCGVLVDWIIEMLRECSQLLSRSGMPEWAYAVEKILVGYYEEALNFGGLSSCYEILLQLSTTARMEATRPSRKPGMFFLVEVVDSENPGLLKGDVPSSAGTISKPLKSSRPMKVIEEGGLVKALHWDIGTSFIVSCREGEMMAEVTNEILGDVAWRFGTSFKGLVPSSHETAMLPGSVYLSVIEVTAQCGAGIEVPFHRRWRGFSRFTHDTPFTQTGAVHGRLSEQWLRRAVFTVAGIFPCLFTRLAVESVEYQVLSPPRCAGEDLRRKTQTFRTYLRAADVPIGPLQQELQGALLGLVNGGAGEVVKTFFEDSTVLERGEDKEWLVKQIQEFLTEITRAVKLHGRLIEVTCEDLEEQT